MALPSSINTPQKKGFSE